MLDQILREIEKEGYSHTPKFLRDEDLIAINAFIDQHKAQFEAARVGPADKKKRVESIRGDFTYWLDPLKPTEPFSQIFKILDQLKDKLNFRFYLGLQDYECHLAYYPSGTYYKKHLDRFEKDGTRKISFIFYLNQKWSPEEGGELILYDQQGEVVETILPMPGTFVCFLSDEYPHEVKPAVSERRSFTGWIHTKKLY